MQGDKDDVFIRCKNLHSLPCKCLKFEESAPAAGLARKGKCFSQRFILWIVLTPGIAGVTKQSHFATTVHPQTENV